MAQATAEERYLLDIINTTRTVQGLDPLTLETRLNASADGHSSWMLQADQFSHTGRNASSATDRIAAAGFDLSGGWSTAENIAYVSVDNDGSLLDEVERLHQMLMDSPGHRANLLSDRSDMVGLGLQLGQFTRDGQTYTVLMLTQNFASTGGDVVYDLAPGVTVSTLDAPEWVTISPIRAGWLPAFNGEVFTRSTGLTELRGTWKGDDIRLSSAADLVNGGGGHDWIASGAGADTVTGSVGNDFIRGEAGRDVLRGGAGHDRIDGGIGDDRIDGGAGDDRLRGGEGGDRIDGMDGNDRIAGGGGGDLLRGGSGHDRIEGDAGRDQIAAGLGSDLINGGAGDDRLSGGGGADSFIFDDAPGRDTVLDFQAGVDRLLIDEDLITGELVDFVQDNIVRVNGGIRIELADGQWIQVHGANLTVAEVADDIYLI
ncbi:hypothetical protein FNJ84_02485 [Paracoccus sp. M683]|uniref:CAP domain-containing protein n=1 Tax=Paracoccus sp. M683 TaxID=2594268 RepID=UPI00117C66FB|nr:CAP domain-containing protein [Paracoccus sp. M683]TRW99562.1 hypothetical protein FNJ84_02485 [Paracoccus sp. M683]